MKNEPAIREWKIIFSFVIFFGMMLVPNFAQVTKASFKLNGISCTTPKGLLQVDFVKPDVVRLRYTEERVFRGNGTDVCVLTTPTEAVNLSHAQQKNVYILKSDSLTITIDKLTGAVTYRDRAGNLLLQENSKTPRTCEKVYTEKVTYNEQSKRVEKTANGDVEVKDILRRDTIGQSWKFRMNFQFQPSEALYGLGSHIENYMNLRGKELYLCQHNLKEMVPVLNSTAGYGLLFDAGCAMVFKDGEAGGLIEMEAAKQIDYYFMKGKTMDAVVANYRLLTGESPMMPLYLFGYTQSKERYVSSDDLVSTLREYRTRQIPIDMIVQDWSYWPNGQWGRMTMNPQFYPDKQKLTDDIHAMHGKLMISIWPSMINCPQANDFRQRGLMVTGENVYDAFNPLARSLYWTYANKEFFSNGFDAWWCDSSEPLDADWSVMEPGYGFISHKKRWEQTSKKLSDALGAERSQTYSLYHAKGIYEHQRATSNNKRVVNLTRSSYAGQQRYSTITWNGDTRASWTTFADMIPAGLNFMATGCPYWTVDIGTFFVKEKNQWFWKGEYEKGADDLGYREFYTRMFQYGAFLPMFRSHGTDTPREVWRFGKPGEPFYDSLIRSIQLRYRLLPYIYSVAGQVNRNGYTMTRALAFDFAKDKQVADIKDEFMFGPSILVAPVTKPMYYGVDSKPIENVDKTRRVYLPAGASWTDFWTGEKYRGGQWITSDAKIDKLPLLIRQGSIIPMGPVVQYSSEKPDAEWKIRIYPGADASFTIYEDEGDNYNYEEGAFSTYTLYWNEKAGTLTLSDRKGCFSGMETVRKMRIVKVQSGDEQEVKGVGKFIEYKGKKIVVKL